MHDLAFTPTSPHDERPDADATYAVAVGTCQIGTVALRLADRPKGATRRRHWYAITPPEDPTKYPRPFDTRRAAADALLYRHRLRTAPPKTPPPDPTADLIRHVRDRSGVQLAGWLAAALAGHHLRETIRTRHTSPAAIWDEIARAATWLTIGTDPD